jgi:hypothetical protein
MNNHRLTIVRTYSGDFHWNVCSGWPEFMFRLNDDFALQNHDLPE